MSDQCDTSDQCSEHPAKREREPESEPVTEEQPFDAKKPKTDDAASADFEIDEAEFDRLEYEAKVHHPSISR